VAFLGVGLVEAVGDGYVQLVGGSFRLVLYQKRGGGVLCAALCWPNRHKRNYYN
jgi:hypothetical protein